MGREGVEFVGGIGLERSNWSLVGPLQPVVIKNNTTWMDSGESTMFFSLASVMSSSLVIVSVTWLGLLMDFLRSTVKLTVNGAETPCK
ncbi:hypothetical protein TB2_028218 [Malus domestica]